MTIATEPIGSIPRPLALIEAIGARGGTDPAPDPLYEETTRDTIERFEATGSPVIADGELGKCHTFWTYRVEGLPKTAEQPGTTDDCGFSPLCDDTSTTHATVFAKIRARVLGTSLAAREIGGGE